MIYEFSCLKHILLYLTSFIKNESNKKLKNNRKMYRMCVYGCMGKCVHTCI